MIKKSIKKYYISKKTKILENFDTKINTFQTVILSQLGMAKTNELLIEIKDEYKRLIPEIVYIESQNNFLLREYKDISICLAFALVMKRHKYSKEEIAAYIFEIQKEMISSSANSNIRPIQLLFNMLQIFPFNKLYRIILKNYEKRIRKEEKALNIQIHYVEGDGKNFDYGIDILRCPICDIWKKHNVSEILPYVCLFDFFKSAITNSGLIRTMTLAEGKEKCDNRFKQGRKTQNKQETQFIKRKSILEGFFKNDK